MFHFGTNHHDNGGTASCRSAVFFGSWRRGEDFERKKEDGEDGSGTRRGRERDSERMGTGLGEEGKRTLRGRNRTERTGLG